MMCNKKRVIARINAGVLGLADIEHFRKLGYALVCEGGKAVDLVEENVDV